MKLSEIDENFKSENINEPDIEWREISEKEIGVYGVFYSEKDKEYLRFPKEFAKSFNDYVYYHANRTSGGRVNFQTNSPYVAIKVVATNLDVGESVNGSMGVSLYTDNYFSKSIYPDMNLLCNSKRGNEITFDGIYRISNPHVVNEIHDFALYMPILNGIKKIYIGIKQGSLLSNGKRYKYEKPIVFYGSSITMGCGTSRAGNDYVSSVCRMIDSDYINLGLAGQAKGQKEMAEYVAKLKASVFVIDYDYNAPTVEHLQETHYPFYKVIREHNPTTPIIFMSQPNTDYCLTTEERKRVILNTYNKAKECDENVYFIDGDTLFQGDLRDNCTNDRCHPNDLGHFRMAKAVYSILDKLLNKEQ